MVLLATLALGLGPTLAPLFQKDGLADAPFQLRLPSGYATFSALEGPYEGWQSKHSTQLASFEVRHFLLESPGAISASVSQQQWETTWSPLVKDFHPRVSSWQGNWGGEDAAGFSIQFESNGELRHLETRVQVDGEHLVVGHWEGPEAAFQVAQAALASFRPPPRWTGNNLTKFDAQKGGGDLDEFFAVPGIWRVLVVVPKANFPEVHVEIQLEGAPKISHWNIPKGSQLLGQDESSCSYRMELMDVRGDFFTIGGLEAGFHFFKALAPAWLAMPQFPLDTPAHWLPPAWEIRVQGPAHLQVLSAKLGDYQFLEETSLRETSFSLVDAEISWPFFVIGNYQEKKAGSVTFFLRDGSKQQTPDEKVLWIHRLDQELQSWLPHRVLPWKVVTAPGTKDWILPGMRLLDETFRWLIEPLDDPWDGLDRRTSLARKATFGFSELHLRPMGSGAPFLSASLGEYMAWRLLERIGRSEEAQTLVQWWLARERQLPNLRIPLSLIPRGDLKGARRLLSRGALTWLAIEKKASRPVLDKILLSLAQNRPLWNTELLRGRLEIETKGKWQGFFANHIYGIQMPPLP